MPQYKAPLEDFRFLYNEFLDLSVCEGLPSMAEATPDVIEAVLEEAAKMTEGVLQPLNEVGDRIGCRFNEADHTVTMPEGFGEAYRTFCEGGWQGLIADPDYGGQGLPSFVGLAVSEMKNAANASFAAYPGLTLGAYEVIHAYGTDEQKQTYLPKMISGEWGGTMNLTEPQCGTDLGPDSLARRTDRGRQLPHFGHQDLDLGRRARHGRQHHPPGPGPPARRAGWHARDQPVHRAQVPGRCRRLAGRAQSRQVHRASKRKWASRPRPPARCSTTTRSAT
jgi:hypothetical protein